MARKDSENVELAVVEETPREVGTVVENDGVEGEDVDTDVKTEDDEFDEDEDSDLPHEIRKDGSIAYFTHETAEALPREEGS